MNDGYSQMDSGMIFGSVNIAHAAEFIYYLKKYNYQGVVFFDTFPIRENAKLETQANINSFEKISKIIDEIGMDRIAEVVSKRDGVEAQRLVLDMFKKRKNKKEKGEHPNEKEIFSSCPCSNNGNRFSWMWKFII